MEVAPHVAQGLFRKSHLAEVVTPGVGAASAAHEGFALDDADGAVGHGALEGLSGHLKGDRLTGFPEGLREVVVEEQGVVAALCVDGVERSLLIFPRETQVGCIPVAEVEAVVAGLADENLQEIETRHYLVALIFVVGVLTAIDPMRNIVNLRGLECNVEGVGESF